MNNKHKWKQAAKLLAKMASKDEKLIHLFRPLTTRIPKADRPTLMNILDCQTDLSDRPKERWPSFEQIMFDHLLNFGNIRRP